MPVYVMTHPIASDKTRINGLTRLIHSVFLGMRHHEPWMQGISNIVNQLNFRASFGIQGNTVNSIGPELILDREGIKQGYGEYFSTISRIPNPNLSWERTKTWNFGIDIQLAWITMNLEYYRKMSNNIVNQGIAPENGIAGMDINGGRIRIREWNIL